MTDRYHAEYNAATRSWEVIGPDPEPDRRDESDILVASIPEENAGAEQSARAMVDELNARWKEDDMPNVPQSVQGIDWAKLVAELAAIAAKVPAAALLLKQIFDLFSGQAPRPVMSFDPAGCCSPEEASMAALLSAVETARLAAECHCACCCPPAQAP